MSDQELLELELRRAQTARVLAERMLEDRLRALTEKTEALEASNRRLERAQRDLRETQAELIQSAKMASIGQLAAGIAHEINNPMSYVLSNVNGMTEFLADLRRLLTAAETAIEKLAGGADAAAVRADYEAFRREVEAPTLLQEFESALADCRSGSTQVREVVTRLREFSHAEMGEMARADLKEGVESALRMCWNEFKFRVEIRRDYGEVPQVLCHPWQINQVFMNLIVNAGQAIEDRGGIEISTRMEEGYAVVRVRDTGRGIEPEHLPRLFEPFFTTKPVGQGTGLGLHLSYKIVRAHGGRIEVASEPGKGTVFTVRLPIDGPEAPTKEWTATAVAQMINAAENGQEVKS